MKTIVKFEINKKLDFQNHLIGARVYKKRYIKGTQFFNYYKKLDKACTTKRKFKVFNESTNEFYNPSKKKFRDMILEQTQKMWNLAEKDYIRIMERVHNRKFPYKRIYGILSTGYRFGYDFRKNKKWFACSYESPAKSVGIVMHEAMHSIFHKYFYNEWKKKFNLTDQQIWTIKEAVTVILNSECSNLMFKKDTGHPGHENLRGKILKDWLKYKNFEKVLDLICKYVKTNKLFLR
jgi:hypothetical protein